MTRREPRHDYLLVSRVGPRSLHRHWLQGGERSFDMLISAYDETVEPLPASEAMFEYRPGPKVAGYGAIITAHEALFRRYRYVGFFDDDLLADAATLSAMFVLADRHGAKIAQPALDRRSFYTYACLLHHPGFTLRHVNYIEMMCPVFRTDVLLAIAPLFHLGFESGIDLLWSAAAHRDPSDFAVIDATPVLHTERVGGAKAANGFTGKRDYEHDIRAALGRYDLPWLPALPYDGLLTSGRTVRSRWELLARALPALTSVRHHFSWKWRVRPFAVYFNQMLRKRTRNVPIWNTEAFRPGAFRDEPPAGIVDCLRLKT